MVVKEGRREVRDKGYTFSGSLCSLEEMENSELKEEAQDNHSDMTNYIDHIK